MECRIRVAAVVIDQGQVLLVSPRQQPAGPLVLPGGGLEEGETLREAAQREVWEEAGLRVLAAEVIACREVERAGWYGVELYLRSHLIGDREPAADFVGEGRHWQWVKVARLPEVAHYPDRLDAVCQQVMSDQPGALMLAGVRF